MHIRRAGKRAGTCGPVVVGRRCRSHRCISLVEVQKVGGADGVAERGAGAMTGLPGAAAWLESASWLIAITLFLVTAAYETLRPDRDVPIAVLGRWVVHFALYACCMWIVFLVVPGQVAARIFGDDRPGSLFGFVGEHGGDAAVLIIGCLLIDLLYYCSHRAEHTVFTLWRGHAVHHSDTVMDVTTTYRHHPLEFLANGLFVATVMAAAGLPIWVFVFYATLSTAAGQLQHMNGKMPDGLDRVMRWVIVTPALHRMHHSAEPLYYNSNYGVVFSIWDRLLGTYRVMAPGQDGPHVYGLRVAGTPMRVGFVAALLLPFTIRRPSPVTGEHSVLVAE